jgi:hypothetical protein
MMEPMLAELRNEAIDRSRAEDWAGLLALEPSLVAGRRLAAKMTRPGGFAPGPGHCQRVERGLRWAHPVPKITPSWAA